MLTAALLASAAPNVNASFDPSTLPVIDAVSAAGGAWASYKFSTDGSPVVADVIIPGAGTTQAGADMFDANGNLIFGFTFTALGAPSSGTLLDVNTPAPAGMNVHYGGLTGTSGSGAMGLSLYINDPDFGSGTAGTYILLLWSAGQASATSIELKGGAGDSLLKKTSGTHTFLFGANDFSGGQTVYDNDGTTGASASVANSKLITVENSLFGNFYDANFKIACAAVCAGGPGTSALTADVPGAAVTQVCGYVDSCFYFGAPAGTYAFHLTQADAFSGQYVFTCQPAPVVGGACAGAFAMPDYVILGGVDGTLAV